MKVQRIGQRRHQVTVQNPSAPIPDGDGGFSVTWSSATPATWHCSIAPATERDLERVAAGTVLSTASHICRGRYHSGVTVESRIVFGSRVFSVTGVSNPDERNIETIAVCVELLNAPPVTDTSWTQEGWIS